MTTHASTRQIADAMAAPPASVAGTALARAAAEPDHVALRYKRHGIWRSISGGKFHELVDQCSTALIALGLGHGARASILANNRWEWVVADFAIMSIGCVSSGIYPTNSVAQVDYQLTDSESVVVFVEDDRQLDKVLEARDRLPLLRKIVVFDMAGLHDYRDPMVVSFETFLDKANGAGTELAARRARVRAEDVALIVYTSGTTGNPKGAQITNRSALMQVEAGIGLLDLSDRDELLSYLPLCHAAERVWNSFTGFCAGATVNYVESFDTLPENTAEIRPTIMLGVPRIWEKMYSAITLRVKDAAPSQKALYRWATASAAATGIGARLAHLALKPLVLDRIKETLGLDRCRLAVTGAAPIAPDLIDWFRMLGIPMVEGYGQTEASGMIAIGLPAGAPSGAVGPAIPGVELRLSDVGEIMVRGECIFAGYLNKDAETAQVIRDGWLHTGDVGMIDAKGNLRITDRLKDVIITAGGKNVTPSEIESQLKFSPYINDAVVIGDRRKFLTALIVIDHETVDSYARDVGLAYRDFAELARSEPVRDLVRREIEAVNARVARVETIKNFRIIQYRLTAEDEEMTPTMKLKRKLVERLYAPLIEEMYLEAGAA